MSATPLNSECDVRGQNMLFCTAHDQGIKECVNKKAAAYLALSAENATLRALVYELKEELVVFNTFEHLKHDGGFENRDDCTSTGCVARLALRDRARAALEVGT